MLEYFMKIMGLSPSPEELEFSKRIDSSWKTLKVSDRGSVSVDIAEILADETFLNQLERAKALVAIKERPAEAAANILRGSRITRKEAEDLIELINYATIP